jgi:hypothetical protein
MGGKREESERPGLPPDGGKWGFVDKTGKLVAPLIYEDVWDFSEGLAAVKMNDYWGFIDKTGRMVIPAVYDDALWFEDGLAKVEKDGQYGFIDITGKEVVAPEFDAIEFFGGARDRVGVLQNDKWGIVDKESGELIITPQYDLIKSFSNGLAAVETKGKWGAINTQGQLVIPQIYDDLRGFNEGFIRAYKDGKWGLIGYDGRIIAPFIYDIISSGDFQPIFSEGLTPVNIGAREIEEDGWTRMEGGKWGFINKQGKLVIPCKYMYVSTFDQGLARVLLSEEIHFFINREGVEYYEP